MIIETSDNRFFRVVETSAPMPPHVWIGLEMKRLRGQWVAKANAKPQLVRKAATKIVEA